MDITYTTPKGPFKTRLISMDGEVIGHIRRQPGGLFQATLTDGSTFRNNTGGKTDIKYCQSLKKLKTLSNIAIAHHNG